MNKNLMLKTLSPVIILCILAISTIIFNTSLAIFKQKFSVWGSLEQPKPPHGEGMVIGTIIAMKYYGIPSPSVPSINIPDVSKNGIADGIANDIKLKQEQAQREEQTRMQHMQEESRPSTEHMIK